MSNLIERLSKIRNEQNNFIERPELIAGYSEAEIREIEQRYNITVQGQLKEWLTTMGKNSGGLLQGSAIRVYSSTCQPTSEYFGQLMQEAWQDEDEMTEFLSLTNHVDLIEKQFFLLGDDEQVYYYFMLTADKDNLVYEYFEDGVQPETLKVFGTLFDLLEASRKYLTSQITGEDDETYYKLTTGRLL